MLNMVHKKKNTITTHITHTDRAQLQLEMQKKKGKNAKNLKKENVNVRMTDKYDRIEYIWNTVMPRTDRVARSSASRQNAAPLRRTKNNIAHHLSRRISQIRNYSQYEQSPITRFVATMEMKTKWGIFRWVTFSLRRTCLIAFKCLCLCCESCICLSSLFLYKCHSEFVSIVKLFQFN